MAISNGRLLRMDARTVTFRYKDYKRNGELREMTLDGTEFVRRLSLHVLPPGFTKIRHYGILGNNRRTKLVPLARQALENSRWRMELAPVKALPKPERDASTCPHCGGKDLVCVGRLDATGHYTSLRRATSHRVLATVWPPKLSDSS